MERSQFHVVPDGDQWKVERDGRAVSTHDTQEEALNTARSAAKSNQPSQLLVHGRDGRIEDESTYQDDPFPPRG